MGRAPGEDDAKPRVQYCTVADARYFPGLVALVNSLRLTGHHEPVHVLDLGLTGAQRATLARECTFADPPDGPPRHPWLFEPYACAGVDAEVVVYVDADVIVVRPLDDLVALAADGGVVAFPDEQEDRWFAEWDAVFELLGPVHHQPYVNAGFLAVSPVHFPHLLDEWARCCDHIVGSVNKRDDPAAARSPVGLSSQDALNAVLMTSVPVAALAVQPDHEAVDRRDMHAVEVVDAQTLECSLAGRRPALLHYWGIHKPWELTSRGYTANAYNQLLRRLLVADDVAVRIDPHEVPRWLRPGPLGNATFGVLEHVVPAVRAVIQPLRRRQPRPVVATANR